MSITIPFAASPLLATSTVSAHRDERLAGHIAAGERNVRTRLLSREEADPRCESLHNACELLADGFEELSEQIEEYVRTVPRTARDTDRKDAERFLDWLAETDRLSDEQQDYVTCQLACNAVEFMALRQRLAHARFQAMLTANTPRRPLTGKLTLYLNPVHVWTTFETQALLDDTTATPATVLFYAAGCEIRTAVIDHDAEELLRDLQRSGPISLRELHRLQSDRETATLDDLITTLCELGIVAVSV